MDCYGAWADLHIAQVTQRFRWMKAGGYVMGSSMSEANRASDEGPYPAAIPKGFWIADTECTEELWKAVTGNDPGDTRPNWQLEPDGIYKEADPKKPMACISLFDCQAFFDDLNHKVPKANFRLPTEIEWEYACRAGTRTAFSFGKKLVSSQANFDTNGVRTVVKSFPPNSWGLYDMHGNVSEWCSDCYCEVPLGISSKKRRIVEGHWVFRGGSCNDAVQYCRSAARNRQSPDHRGFIGLRIVFQPGTPPNPPCIQSPK